MSILSAYLFPLVLHIPSAFCATCRPIALFLRRPRQHSVLLLPLSIPFIGTHVNHSFQASSYYSITHLLHLLHPIHSTFLLFPPAKPFRNIYDLIFTLFILLYHSSIPCQYFGISISLLKFILAFCHPQYILPHSFPLQHLIITNFFQSFVHDPSKHCHEYQRSRRAYIRTQMKISCWAFCP